MAVFTTIQCKIQRRVNTAAGWTSDDTILLLNEEGIESDTGKRKLGDGSTAWTSLGYLPAPAGTVSLSYTAKTSNYTITGSDDTVNCTSGTFNITLLSAVGIAGKLFNIKNSGTGLITILTTSSQTIDGIASGVLILEQYVSLTVQSDGANWIIIGARPA